MTQLRVLKVFTGPDGRGGNPLGVVLDGSAVPPERRQAVAAALGFSETVFVDDAASGRIHIFTPGSELAFAGHPTVGTGRLLRALGIGGDVLRPPAGDVLSTTAVRTPRLARWNAALAPCTPAPITATS